MAGPILYHSLILIKDEGVYYSVPYLLLPLGGEGPSLSRRDIKEEGPTSGSATAVALRGGDREGSLLPERQGGEAPLKLYRSVAVL